MGGVTGMPRIKLKEGKGVEYKNSRGVCMEESCCRTRRSID
jgi:hypothetical protein